MPSNYDTFDAVLFDMDGTLLDSMPYWRRINTDFLESRGLPKPETLHADLTELSNRVCARAYSELPEMRMTFEEIFREYQQRMSVYYATAIEPKPGAKKYLRQLREHGKRLCVATATSSALALPALEKHGLMEEMEFLLSASDLGMKKENPDYFLAVAEKLGVAPERCVMFEDALYAMRGAKAAGMHVYAIEDAVARPDVSEIQKICDVFVHSFEELLDR